MSVGHEIRKDDVRAELLVDLTMREGTESILYRLPDVLVANRVPVCLGAIEGGFARLAWFENSSFCPLDANKTVRTRAKTRRR